jgi:hypothetical protein
MNICGDKGLTSSFNKLRAAKISPLYVCYEDATPNGAFNSGSVRNGIAPVL